jgi:hypothetical protein
MRKRVLVALAAAAMLVLLPTAAWAHHPLLKASVDCEGVLTFKAWAWKGQGEGEALEKSRTNDDIRITLHTKDGPAEGVEIAKGAFNKDNNFSFSGTHELDAVITEEVVVRATAKVNWANGAGPGKPAEAKVKPPTDCQTTTTKPEDTTTTTKPEDTTTTTQPEDTTTTTQPEETTTTVAPTTTLAPPSTAPPAAGGGLPLTGASTAPVLLSIAAGLIAAGGTAVYLARRRSGAGAES